MQRNPPPSRTSTSPRAAEPAKTRTDTARAGQDDSGRPGTGIDEPDTGRPGTGTHPQDAATGGLGARLRRALRHATRPGPWKRGRVLAALALLLGLLLPLHARITDRAGLGSLVETFLPWSGLGVLVLLAAALRRRSATALAALLVPVTVWLSLFGGLLGDKSHPGGDLTLVGHNVGADNPDPAGTARALAASHADVLALEEITARARPLYEKALAATYPYHSVQGTVGLWSTLPLSDVRPVDTKMDAGPLGEAKPADVKLAYTRALRATVATDRGPLAVYVAHLGSVRVLPTGFWTGSRDRNAGALADALAAERNQRMVLLGDLNGTADDRALAGITSRLRSAQDEAGSGFGFSWPAAFPVARIDQILVRGVRPESSWVLPATGSDHLPVAARISL
ncbi:endonuclease/exonuclease/phosphatase family protein [Streptomyces sp. ASQP_92]|uniref:endonuclease/exonuclease/phosphatase family protein n=1 Tax=Streptomyces sp. ASQP_92 TaxID=2979116 RepID=UPI0021C02430|nr:endonuclease/exonuclease/phosphatase family protein [Streptomyces sp. ASQP_92]MCT9091498.1 endonuclease/exonuclease/phosphatase family protein [Streptomyces sp. ASQP_92]